MPFLYCIISVLLKCSLTVFSASAIWRCVKTVIKKVCAVTYEQQVLFTYTCKNQLCHALFLKIKKNTAFEWLRTWYSLIRWPIMPRAFALCPVTVCLKSWRKQLKNIKTIDFRVNNFVPSNVMGHCNKALIKAMWRWGPDSKAWFWLVYMLHTF